MSKKTNAVRVINYLDSLRIKYQVLDACDLYPIHIRLRDMDIWPSTGSYRKGNTTVRRNIDKLMEELDKMLGGSSSKDSVKEKDNSPSLTEIVLRLEARITKLELLLEAK